MNYRSRIGNLAAGACFAALAVAAAPGPALAVKVGEPAPAFTATDSNGKQVSLAQFKEMGTDVLSIEREFSATANRRELRLSLAMVDGLPEALTLPYAERDALTHHAGSEDGRLYVQDLASQWSAHALDAQPGETILDLAAAPGGKTGFIAARMANTGSLSAVEPVRDRFFRMTQNLKRLGVTNVKFYMKDGRTVGRLVAGRFDRVMLDAPCSSEARFDPRDPGSFSHWSERKVQEVSRKQRALILSGFEALRPGGLMVYSTCSYAPEENEAVVAHLLSQVGGQAELLPLDLPGAVAIEGLTRWADEPFPEALRQTRRLLPAGASHGFYIARIRKAVQG